jgi:sugar/nucleoside kinase (ribokinase family)
MVPERIPEAFFEAPILLYGGTALVPNLHARLDEALERGRASGALNVVTTVYDFYNQSRDPKGRWPIGRSERSYPNIDLLITDLEEARRLSGTEQPAAALEFFRKAGVGAAIITHGNNDVHLFAAEDSRFAPLPHTTMPVSARVASELAAGAGANGDTTGCGDNFCGGVLYALAEQYRSSREASENGGTGAEASAQRSGEANARERYDLAEALRWGIVSGGFACFYVGGTYFEEHPDQKRSALVPYYEAYLRQGAGS